MFRKLNFLAQSLKNLSNFWKWNVLASYFVYISEWNFPDSKSKKNNTLKKCHIFQEIEFSSPKYKKFLIFKKGTFWARKRKTSYISRNNFFFISSNWLGFLHKLIHLIFFVGVSFIRIIKIFFTRIDNFGLKTL